MKIEIFGKNFAPQAEAYAIGIGNVYLTVWGEDGFLKGELDVYGVCDYVLGIIVLNNPYCFSHESSSNIVPLQTFEGTLKRKTDEQALGLVERVSLAALQRRRST